MWQLPRNTQHSQRHHVQVGLQLWFMNMLSSEGTTVCHSSIGVSSN